jgi:DNA-binding NarL/FixJ family response regulator
MSGEQPTRKPVRDGEAQWAGRSGLRVLVVEDHPLMRERLAAILHEIGAHMVGLAGDCAGAIEQACSLIPDLVLLDLSLPDGSGFQVLNTLQRTLPQCRVVIMTAYEDAELERACLAAGAAAFIGKSRLRPQLLEVVNSLGPGQARSGPGVRSSESAPGQ